MTKGKAEKAFTLTEKGSGIMDTIEEVLEMLDRMEPLSDYLERREKEKWGCMVGCLDYDLHGFDSCGLCISEWMNFIKDGDA